MDDQAVILTYGNTDLPEGTAERPLVTFALFAYNQEKYIREAVEGAFSQTYSPLEIILSDDCSTDRTFEIMEEMAREYRGPHLVKVRRGKNNLGTLNHVLDVANNSIGEYIAVAAGDDISKPDRVDISLSRMRSNGIDIASFACEEFIEGPDLITAHRRAVQPISDKLLLGSPKLMQIHGASACYKSQFLKSLPYSSTKILLEDYIFRIFAFWSGARIGAFEDSILFHRIHSNNIGPKNKSPHMTEQQHEMSICQHYQRLSEALNYLSGAERDFPSRQDAAKVGKHRISKKAMTYTNIRARWPTLSLKERFWLLTASRHFDNPRRDFLRAFGSRVYFAVTRLL